MKKVSGSDVEKRQNRKHFSRYQSEFYAGQVKESFFEKAGITMLYDTIIKINDSFYQKIRNTHFL